LKEEGLLETSGGLADPARMSLPTPTMDEAVALLTAYQDRLDRAIEEGPTRYDGVFKNPPAARP
jgi:hypothetical protein